MGWTSLFRAMAWLLVLCTASWTCGCSFRGLVVDEMTGVIETGIGAFEQESDLPLLERSLPANMKLLETLLANRPKNTRLLILLSRLYAGYTFSFVEKDLEAALLTSSPGDDTERAVAQCKASLNRNYRKGVEYALRALELRHPECRAQLSKVTTVNAFLQSVTEADIPALYWYGFNLGAYVHRNRDSMQAVAKAHLAEKTMQRILELNPEYENGGAHLLLMVYYASRAPMMGGNPEKALHHYRMLKDLSGETFLLADVLYARYCLYQAQKRKEYEKLLTQLLQGPPVPDPHPMMNAVALQRARIYRDAADRLFQ